VSGEEISRSAPAPSKVFWRLLILLAVLQAALIAFEQRNEIVNWLSRPFMQADYAYHYYFSTRQAESTLMGRGFTGYDPNMFGGMDLWPQVTPSDRLTVLLLTLSPKNWWPGVFNFQYLAMFLLIPVLFLAAARRFGVNTKGLTYAVPIGLILFWFTLPSFMSRGIVTFVFSLFLALYIASEIYSLTLDFSHIRAAMIAFLTALLVFIHPAAAFVIGFLALTILIAQRKQVDRRIGLWIVVAALLTFAFNWPWASVLPWFKYSSASTASALTFPSLAAFWDYHYVVPGISGLRIFLPAVLVVGSLPIVIKDDEYRRRAILAALWTLFFTALYVFGSFVPVVKLMQPQRFNIGVKVMGAFYAVMLLSYLLERTRMAVLARPPIAATVGALAVAVCAWASKKAYLGDTYATHPMRQVESLLRQSTEEGSRILLIRGPHTPGTPPDVDEQCYLGSYLNRDWLGTEWIVPTLSKFGHDNIGTHTGLVEGKATKEEWGQFRNRWEIEYVAFPSAHRRLYSSWLSGVQEVGEAGGYVLYNATGDNDRFLIGTGNVSASLNELSFNNVSSGPGNSVVIAYHLSVGHKLVDGGNAALSRDTELGDKYGFIKIRNPQPSFKISFDVETARGANR
jgi:hypothetical protein